METTRPQRLKGISPRAWEHPADKAALQALKMLPGFDSLLRMVFGATLDRFVQMRFTAEAVRTGPVQFARVHRLAEEVRHTLDIEKPCPVFVAYNPQANAGAWGFHDPVIVLHSGLVDMLDDQELSFVLAHEYAHAASGHALYHTLLQLLISGGFRMAGVGPDALTYYAIVLALQEWNRKSELSADRAGLLAIQDQDAVLRAFMKLAGGSRIEEMDLDAFKAQADTYVEPGNPVDEISKVLLLAFRSHPMPVLRLKEITQWVDGGGYQSVLGGTYPRRDPASGQAETEDENKGENKAPPPPSGADVLKSFGEAADHYAKEVSKGLDNFFKSLKG